MIALTIAVVLLLLCTAGYGYRLHRLNIQARLMREAIRNRVK